ncbi:AraC family transcriptional regulator [Pseudonocardia kongjuensis]|uniref:AraC family transcriptional regulator n=1 Tax=Pseudonocardia kongjuensis TaxID=102227 RepID=A0ABP4IED1_9PSEU
MDAFGDLFRGVRAQGSLFGSSTLTAPWSLRFVDGAPLTLCTVLDGAGWIVPDGRPAEHLAAGDMLVVRGPARFSFVDAPGTAAEPIECGESCAVPELGGTQHRLGWHDDTADRPGSTTLVTGAYPVTGEIGRRLLDALPDVLRLAPDGTADAVRALLAAEVAVDAPGQQVVLDRLLDWLLVCTLREWFDRPGGAPPAWYSAHRDPVVGHALRLLHEEPAAPWTVSSLAERAGVSRATLAKRFTELVGEPPLTYLTGWRMTLAADLLTGRDGATVAEVARSVGYSDAFGFSAAFKRVRGVTPSDFRRTGGGPVAGSPPGSPAAERSG